MRELSTWLATAALLLAMLSVAPDRPRKDPEIADLGLRLNPTNWGTIHLDRSTGEIRISDNPSYLSEGAWAGKGTVRGNLVILRWSLDDVEDVALSVYHVQRDGSLRGVWGWSDECRLEGDVLLGFVHQSWIFKDEEANDREAGK